MKRFTTLLLAALLIIGLVPVSLAAEGESTQDFYIKYKASDFRSVCRDIAEGIDPEADFTVPSGTFTADTTFQVGAVTCNLHCVKPTYDVANIPNVASNSEENSSYSSLNKYIKSKFTYTQTNSDYEEALGNVTDDIVYPAVSSKTYVGTGTTYTLDGSINDVPVSVTLRVSSVSGNAPDVYLSMGRRVECDPKRVEYSLDRKTWKGVSNGSSLPEECSGTTVYFRTPATDTVEASDTIELLCKDDQDKPSGKLELASNSYSVWVTNASDFSGCEFCINEGAYSKTTTLWERLNPNTSYKVSVRKVETKYKFPSEPLTSSIKTTEAAKSELTYKKLTTADTTYIQAEGTSAFRVSSKQLSASYGDETVRELKADIKELSRKADVVTTLDVNVVQEETDDREYDRIRFSIPKFDTKLQLRLHTPWFTVIRDDETTYITLCEGVQGYNSGVKKWADGLSHVYQVTTEKKGAVTIVYPWEWSDRADLDGLEVSYIDNDGKESRVLDYIVVTGGIKFTMPANGYFAVKNLNRQYPSLPFEDCQTNWAYSYISHAYETGLVKGTSDTTFEPDGPVTRSQLVMLLARMRGYDDSKWYDDLYFTDVTEHDWYARALSFCCAAGAIEQDNVPFEPNEVVTRAETVALTEALFPYTGTVWSPFNCKDREEVPTFALQPMDALYTSGTINGTSPDTFSPDGYLTRAEIVTILYRLQSSSYWKNDSWKAPKPVG